jgi:hypothetical protein
MDLALVRVDPQATGIGLGADSNPNVSNASKSV